MAQLYKISSTKKLEQMVKDISAQLSALKTEIEENGVLQGTPSKSYSSVSIPKDISYFCKENEQVLRLGLQVAEALPLVSQAETMQRELESCLSLEYTPESLPLLLHQFFADRCYQLAQCKYLHMLRWKRFCQHSGIIQQLYPSFKKQVAHLTREYEDAVQRARRLAPSREKVLSGRGDPVNVITQEDMVIYLQWLVCHLHSVKTIHAFLRELQYLPAHEGMVRDASEAHVGGDTSSLKDSTSADPRLPGATEVPTHVLSLDEFGAQLQQLVTHFNIRYDTQGIRNTAGEMELFSIVSREFKAIFRKQETMKTFPVYDGMEAVEGQWRWKNASVALKKEANWIPFIRVKPRPDPWQQKLMMKLKEKNCMDELLYMHCRFLQGTDHLKVMDALKEHATCVSDHALPRPPSVTSRTAGQTPAQIWKRMNSAASQFRQSGLEDSGLSEGDKRGTEMSKIDRRAASTNKEKDNRGSYSYVDSMQLLGLDDGQAADCKDPTMTRGAYLSLLCLRYLRIRELQRACLGMLNYLRSVERTLTYDTAGLGTERGELVSSADDSGWMSAARGGNGATGGLGSRHYLHNTFANYKVHCAEFMEFPEVENQHDFYTNEEELIHTQDQSGLFIVYDVALKDLAELEHTLLLVASHYIRTSRGKPVSHQSPGSESDLQSWAQVEVDRLAILLDLWTCEELFLRNKLQLLDSYLEAYQHVIDAEERFGMAQVITDIMHRRPQFDLDDEYFVQVYRAELVCLQGHLQLIRLVLNRQIDEQRQYLQRIWRDGQKESVYEYGLPLNYIPKQLVSVGNNSSALTNVFLLEFHPSLCLASRVHQALRQAHTEICQLHQTRVASERVALEHKLLRQAQQKWEALVPPGAWYSSQAQKDLFSDVFFENPIFVRDIGLSVVGSAEGEGKKSGKERQFFTVETFSKLLELVTIRHRLIESASETAQLSQLYRSLACELGFEEFHLYLRPVQFEFAVLTEKVEKPPVFITALLQDDSSVDRYNPSSLLLAIQEVDENHIGKFSFYTQEAVLHLMSKSGIENLQVALVCQVTQKNALFSAIKLASLCFWSQKSVRRRQEEQRREEKVLSSISEVGSSGKGDTKVGKDIGSQSHQTKHASGREAQRAVGGGSERPAEAFVSIQLEKVAPRDEMLNAFVKKKEVMGAALKNPDELKKIKRRLILEFCQRFSGRMSHHCIRGQIVGLYRSLGALLDDFPDVRQTHFMTGQAYEQKSDQDSVLGLQTDARSFHPRPRCVLSADGKTLLNLWFIPHFTEVLTMFKSLEETACRRALDQTLGIVSALHDIVYYLVSFARLGNQSSLPSVRTRVQVTADWGGPEGIGVELRDIQKQIETLPHPGNPVEVGHLLSLRREVLFLQFDAAVRHRIRETFLSSGNSAAYQTVTDNMSHALPLLSDSMSSSVYSCQLLIPQPLAPRCPRARRMYPWRYFLGQHGPFPLTICDIPPIEYSMQLCLSGLNDHSRMVANGEILGVSLLMEDVLNSGQDVHPFCLQVSREHDPCQGATPEAGRCDDLEVTGGVKTTEALLGPQRDPVQVYSVMKAFLVLWKQLEVFKESWGRRQLNLEEINTLALYKKFSKLYSVEILYPSMRAVARQLGREQEYVSLLTDTQPLPAPPGASEVDIITQQLHRLLESMECEMMSAVQKRIARDLTLVISERARRDAGLPTELWKRPSMRHCFSPERPQIVENFVQQLMEGSVEAEGKLTFSKAHLQECLTALACAVMEREHGNFQAYSLFYEHILQQESQLLHWREQDLKALKESQVQNNGSDYQLANGMMMEITALRNRLAHVEEEKETTQQQLSSQLRRRYDSLVRHLFSSCFQMKSELDGYYLRMDQDVSRLVSQARTEGVENIIRLKKRLGSAEDDLDALKATLSKHEELQDLREENNHLAGLLCKLKALGHWKQTVSQGRLRRQLHQCEQEAVLCQKEGLQAKMASEEEVTLLQRELNAVRRALSQSQDECSRATKRLHKLTQELQEREQRSAQEARSRQYLDGIRMTSLERLQENAADREQQLEALSGQLLRSNRANQLQRRNSEKELREVRSQLLQERSLKFSAFQRVDELQSQVYDFETALSRSSLSSGRNRMPHSAMSLSASRTQSTLRGLALHGRLAAQSPFPPTRDRTKNDRRGGTEPVYIADRDGFGLHLQRPKTGPSRLRLQVIEALSPELGEDDSSKTGPPNTLQCTIPIKGYHEH